MLELDGIRYQSATDSGRVMPSSTGALAVALW